MTYSDIISNFNLYANVMNTIYVEQTEKNLLSDPNYRLALTMLADGAFATLYTPLDSYIRPFIDIEKINYDNRIADLNQYANTLYTSGRTISVITDYEAYKSNNYFQEVDHMYRLYYILEYYQEMTDTSLPTCWASTPERFSSVNDDAHKYFEDRSLALLNQLS